MGVFFTISAIVAVFGQAPEISAAEFSQIVKERSADLKTIVFVYEGQMRSVRAGKSGSNPDKFIADFQGTYLYRAGGAGLFDIYEMISDPTVGIVRRKASVIAGRKEECRVLLDAKSPPDPEHDIRVGSGSLSSLNDTSGPQDLFWTWYWPERGDLSTLNYTFQGWEDVNGRSCLRFQIDLRRNSTRHDMDFQRFWIDLERNAHVVKTDTYANGNVIAKNDITLIELPAKDGKPIWFPARSHTKWYIAGSGPNSEPFSDRTIEIVRGSVRINIDLPDSLFTVRRATALPTVGELAALEATSASGNLRKEFEAQPAKEPFRTDPASIRQRIDKNLAEADKQSKELEASSPARSTWTVTTGLQLACVVSGVGLLAGVFYWKWKGQ